MENVTKGEFKTIGLHICKVGGAPIGQSFIVNYRHDLRGKFVPDNEGLANAELFTDAINTHNTTGYTPSQLLEQNRELVEALKGLPALLNVSADVLQMRAEEMRRDSVYAPQLKDKSKLIQELIQKHSNNV